MQSTTNAKKYPALAKARKQQDDNNWPQEHFKAAQLLARDGMSAEEVNFMTRGLFGETLIRELVAEAAELNQQKA